MTNFPSRILTTVHGTEHGSTLYICKKLFESRLLIRKITDATPYNLFIKSIKVDNDIIQVSTTKHSVHLALLLTRSFVRSASTMINIYTRLCLHLCHWHLLVYSRTSAPLPVRSKSARSGHGTHGQLAHKNCQPSADG